MPDHSNSKLFWPQLGRKTFALSGLLPLVTMTACGSPKPPQIQLVPEIHNIYPSIPANFLDCVSEPVPGEIKTDVQAAQFAESLRTAGADCRSKLGVIKKTVDGWPK